MALIKCPECGKEISDKAKKCPNCGVPIAEVLPSINNSTLNQNKRQECANRYEKSKRNIMYTEGFNVLDGSNSEIYESSYYGKLEVG